MNVKGALNILKLQKRGIFIGSWIIGCVLALSLYFISEHYYKNQREQRTQVLIEQAVELVKERFAKYEYGLSSTRGAILIADDKDLSRQRFDRYISSLNLVKEFPGARGFGFIRRVFVDQQDDFVRRARSDAMPDFTIRTLTPHNKDRFIIQYIYPEQNNKEAIGLDIGSETYRRAAALTAAITGKATLSAPITLVQEEGKPRRGFLILLPVYSGEPINNLAENRLNATIGWSYAPLVVDDVLFDLGPILSEIDLMITDKVEQTPFFNTAKENQKESVAIVISREIEFMGRKWVVRASPHENTHSGLFTSSPTLLLFLVFLNTCFSYLIASTLPTSPSEKLLDSNQDERVSLVNFFASRGFMKLSKGYLLIMLCIMVISGYLYIEQEVHATSSVLINHSRYSQGLINKQRKNYSEGLAFIKSALTITTMLEAQDRDNPSFVFTNAWKERLGETFKAYMQSQQDMYQIRLIRADAQGKELLRVERKEDAIIIAPDHDLQNKGDRDYFSNTLKLSNGDIYTSSIGPNIENGKMEMPIRLTRRYATPIFYPDGTPFAIIVINVDSRSLLDEISQLSTDGRVIYITNEHAKFILADDESKVYSSFSESDYDWNSIYQRTTNLFDVLDETISTWTGSKGSFISADIVMSPNSGKVAGKLKISATQMTTKIYKNAFLLLFKQFLILLAFSSLALVFIYFSWASSKRMAIAAQIKKQLAAQKQKDNMFESLTELSPEAMVIIDISGKIILINSQTEKLFGYSREQLVGQKINILVPDAIASKHDAYVEKYIKQPVARPMGMAKELYGRYADGSEFPVEVSLSPIQLDDRMLVASSIRNISQRKSIENSLKKAMEKAKSASQAKSAFLANMSHEIRTPLNAVIGLTHLLKGEKLNVEQQGFVNNIQLAGRSLLGIVNDILDLSKIEANEMTVVQAPCNLQEVLDEIFNVFANQAERKNIELRLEIDPDLAFWVLTDRKLMQQIITNLLSNAIKFTDQGRVTLKATRVHATNLSASQQLVCFTIEDTGIGIAKEIQEKIFQPFNQADEGINRRFEGTGLGLSIVRDLSRLLGGEVGVVSEQGKGSQFWFKVPFSAANTDEYFSSDSIVEALNIWIISDQSEGECLLKSICSSLGWRFFCGSTVDLITREFAQCLHKKSCLPDVLVIDWQLYQLQSLSIIERIYNIPKWREIPIIAVGSKHQKEHIEQLASPDRVQGILVKPVAASELFSMVNNTLAAYTGNTTKLLESTKMEAIKAKWLPDVRILVVDDSQMNLDVVEKILTNNGAKVTTANSASDAIDNLKNHPDEFDVVLMDVQMPVMDGLEATSYIRQHLNVNHLPIIALTAGTLADEKTRALSAGMSDFLSKPIEPAKLILCLRKHVEHYREKAVMIDSFDDENAGKESTEWPQITGISNSIGLFQGNLSLFKFTLQRLFEEHRDLESLQVEKLTLASHEERLLIADKIHKLRGSSGMVGARVLYDLSSRAEISLRKGEDAGQQQLLAEIIKAFIALRKNSKDFFKQQAEAQSLQSKMDRVDVKEMDKSELESLIVALKKNDLSAAQIVAKNAHSLTVLLGEDKYALFNEYMQVLNYVKAVALLEKR